MIFSAHHVEMRRTANVKAKPTTHETVKGDGIICLLDGVKTVNLRRHLLRRYNMSAGEYLKQFHLPNDYPMSILATSNYKISA